MPPACGPRRDGQSGAGREVAWWGGRSRARHHTKKTPPRACPRGAPHRPGCHLDPRGLRRPRRRSRCGILGRGRGPIPLSPRGGGGHLPAGHGTRSMRNRRCYILPWLKAASVPVLVEDPQPPAALVVLSDSPYRPCPSHPILFILHRPLPVATFTLVAWLCQCLSQPRTPFLDSVRSPSPITQSPSCLVPRPSAPCSRWSAASSSSPLLTAANATIGTLPAFLFGRGRVRWQGWGGAPLAHRRGP